RVFERSFPYRDPAHRELITGALVAAGLPAAYGAGRRALDPWARSMSHGGWPDSHRCAIRPSGCSVTCHDALGWREAVGRFIELRGVAAERIPERGLLPP
ncbi:MAG: hypothetical protein KDI56_16380, partial [Xanthomonadales bacterium]|nr:hypothetical protein [Xanthomonadales bacterium]